MRGALEGTSRPCLAQSRARLAQGPVCNLPFSGPGKVVVVVVVVAVGVGVGVGVCCGRMIAVEVVSTLCLAFKGVTFYLRGDFTHLQCHHAGV